MTTWARPRIGTPRDLSRPTLGGPWAYVIRGLGFDPHPWQQLRADVQYELVPRRDGFRLAARVSATMVSRQSGKTASSGADILLRALAPDLEQVVALVGHPIGPQHIAFTAQDRQNALAQWENHVDLIMASEFAEFVKGGKPNRTHGSECLHFTNGSSYRIVTPSREGRGIRGMSLDLAVIDEALTHEAGLLTALAPTQAQHDSARNSFGAQLMIISNAGDERSELLNLQRELGRRAVAENDRRRVWLEWSCDDGDDPLDPVVWARTIPTLDQPDGIESSYLAFQAESLGTDDFAREYLCRTTWSQARHVIGPDAWAGLPHLQVAENRVIAVEVTTDRSSAAVVAAEPQDGGIAVRVVDHRAGVDWVVDFVNTLDAQLVVIDQYGPASTLIPALARSVNVHQATSRHVADAAAGFVDAVAAARIGHTGDPRFQDAITWLARRQRGDRWAFDRSHRDVATIVAASLAVWAVETVPSETSAVF